MHGLGWDELIGFLDTAAFTGLLFEGQFLEVDGVKRFWPMSTPVYLETATSLLKLSTGANGGNVLFSVVDAPTWDAFRVQTAMSLESAHIFNDYLTGKVDV